MSAARFASWPMRWKLVGLLSVATALPLAVALAVNHVESRRLARAQSVALMNARADDLAPRLDTLHSGYAETAMRVALAPDVVEFCSAPEGAAREKLARVMEVRLG